MVTNKLIHEEHRALNELFFRLVGVGEPLLLLHAGSALGEWGELERLQGQLPIGRMLVKWSQQGVPCSRKHH